MNTKEITDICKNIARCYWCNFYDEDMRCYFKRPPSEWNDLEIEKLRFKETP